MSDVETFEVNGLTVRIKHDDDPSSPREWDNLGTMNCWHRRYKLGDEHRHATGLDMVLSLLPDDVAERLDRWKERQEEKRSVGVTGAAYRAAMEAVEEEYRERVRDAADKVAIILPLYLYDHSGITMRCSPFSCPWDSGQVGWTYVTLDKVRKEYSAKRITKRIREMATKALVQEVKTYDDYLTGQVYGFVIEDEDGEQLDSCWGFYGLDYCKEAAASAAKALTPKSVVHETANSQDGASI